jgi:hypothetical protein
MTANAFLRGRARYSEAFVEVKVTLTRSALILTLSTPHNVQVHRCRSVGTLEANGRGWSGECFAVVFSPLCIYPPRCGQKNLFRLVKCCLIGARCNQVHIVSVAVHPGFEDAPRNIDLYVDLYVKEEVKPLRGSKPIGDGAECIRRYPPAATREQRFQWSIFSENLRVSGRRPCMRGLANQIVLW